MPHVSLISFSLIWSHEYLVRSTDCEAFLSRHFILGQLRGKWIVKFLDSVMHSHWTASIDLAVDISLMQLMLLVAGHLLLLQCHRSPRCQRRHWHTWFSRLDPRHQAALLDSRHFSACIITSHTGMFTYMDALISRTADGNEVSHHDTLFTGLTRSCVCVPSNVLPALIAFTLDIMLSFVRNVPSLLILR